MREPDSAKTVTLEISSVDRESNGCARAVNSSLRLARCNALLVPRAWMWTYLGDHVTVDERRALELIEMGEVVTTLYEIVVC